MSKSCTPCQWREGLSVAAVSMWSPRCSSCATHANGGMDKADFSIRNRRSAAVSWRPHRRPHDDTSRSGRHGRPEPSLLWGGRPLNLPRCSHKHSLLACPHPSSRALALRTHRRPAAVVTHDSIGRPEPSLLWVSGWRGGVPTPGRCFTYARAARYARCSILSGPSASVNAKCKVAPGSIVTLEGDSTVVSTTRGAGAGHGESQSENTPSMAAGCKLGSPNVARTLTRAGHLHVPSTLYM